MGFGVAGGLLRGGAVEAYGSKWGSGNLAQQCSTGDSQCFLEGRFCHQGINLISGICHILLDGTLLGGLLPPSPHPRHKDAAGQKGDVTGGQKTSRGNHQPQHQGRSRYHRCQGAFMGVNPAKGVDGALDLVLQPPKTTSAGN